MPQLYSIFQHSCQTWKYIAERDFHSSCRWKPVSYMYSRTVLQYSVISWRQNGPLVVRKWLHARVERYAENHSRLQENILVPLRTSLSNVFCTYAADWECLGQSTTVFTARCTLVQSAVLRSHVVCPSVCLSVTLRYCDYIGWKSSKIISRLVSLGCSLFATPTSRGYSKGNTLKFGLKVADAPDDLSVRDNRSQYLQNYSS